MTNKKPGFVSFIFTAITFTLIAGCTSRSETDATPTEPSRTVNGQILTSQHAPAAAINIAANFKYVGGQRFILREHTDVEQHFFVNANDAGLIEKMYWLQFEAKLPGNSTRFGYSDGDSIELGDIEFISQTRLYEAAPEEDSDRGAAYRYLAANGFNVANPAIRTRLIHIPDDTARQELMIVYLETNNIPAEVQANISADLTKRAIEGLSIRVPHQHDH